MTVTTLKGNIAREAPGRNRKYAEGRICISPECNTKLSIYNSGKTCSLHTPFKAPIMRGRKSSSSVLREGHSTRSNQPQ